MRTVVNILDVHPVSQRHVVCPKCRFLYRIDPDNPSQNIPETCTRRMFDEVCGTSLLKAPKSRSSKASPPPLTAHSEFRHQPMKDYLARMHSRPDIEPHLHGNPLNNEKPGSSNEMWDIWDSSCLSNLKGPDNKPFVGTEASDEEGRLVFSLNMDGFNPRGNREAGKKVSIGGIYMICYNLPPSLRYKMENIYLVGVIPGPNAPSDHEINYFLEPIIDEMLELWRHGVFLSRTSMRPHGHRIRCAIGPLVCDLPAARQMSGFAHYRSRNFCSECTQTLDNINDLDYHTWTKRTCRAHRAAAKAWRDAESQEEREGLMRVHGVRWSELLRLPYWDPTTFTVIDPMHAFYLRLFQHHCRSVWGMDINFQDGDGITFDTRSNAPTEVEMKRATHLLRHGSLEMLFKLRVDILRQLCRETSTLPYQRKKKVLCEQLRLYVRTFVEFCWLAPGTHSSNRAAHSTRVVHRERGSSG